MGHPYPSQVLMSSLHHMNESVLLVEERDIIIGSAQLPESIRSTTSNMKEDVTTA
jgi:hypothetical protein